jgi:5S rRNA maturation endonuclease (ribonuclease M5)
MGAQSRTDRLERLENALDRLRQDAEGAVLVAEGARDLAALANLGIGGEHFAVHTGETLEAVIERLAHFPRVILLVDWDRTGGRLVRRLSEGLQHRVRLDTESRRRLASICHCRSLEDVPAELSALRAG